MPSHREQIVDQFTRQAVPFSNASNITDERALRLLVESSGTGPDDTVLDVACGPGIVVAGFAKVARHVTGIDVTPAMVARARELTAACTNVTLEEGDVLPLPYAGGAFSIVVSRLAFHHFPDPRAVLAEMRRVCRPGGRVVVCDLVPSDDPAQAAAFHRVEMLRDPSHVRAHPVAALRDMFSAVGLAPRPPEFYSLPFELEAMLQRSFPRPEDVETIRAAYTASVATDALGMGSHRVGEQVHAAYRVAIFVAVV